MIEDFVFDLVEWCEVDMVVFGCLDMVVGFVVVLEMGDVKVGVGVDYVDCV